MASVACRLFSRALSSSSLFLPRCTTPECRSERPTERASEWVSETERRRPREKTRLTGVPYIRATTGPPSLIPLDEVQRGALTRTHIAMSVSLHRGLVECVAIACDVVLLAFFVMTHTTLGVYGSIFMMDIRLQNRISSCLTSRLLLLGDDHVVHRDHSSTISQWIRRGRDDQVPFAASRTTAVFVSTLVRESTTTDSTFDRGRGSIRGRVRGQSIVACMWTLARRTHCADACRVVRVYALVRRFLLATTSSARLRRDVGRRVASIQSYTTHSFDSIGCYSGACHRGASIVLRVSAATTDQRRTHVVRRGDRWGLQVGESARVRARGRSCSWRLQQHPSLGGRQVAATSSGIDRCRCQWSRQEGHDHLAANHVASKVLAYSCW